MEQPGIVQRAAQVTFGALPTRLRVALVHIFAPSYSVGALCTLEHEGQILLLRQRHRHGWTLPGGLLNRGETAEQAAVREVREETGLVVQLGLPFAVVVEPSSRRVDVLFYVPVDRAVEVVPSSEATHAAWLAPADAGNVDVPTRQAFAALARSRQDGAHRGRLL